MSINSLIPIPITTTAYAPNGQMYQKTNAGKVIGGTVGAIAGISSSSDSGLGPTSIDTAVMTAVGVGIGAAVDYLANKQREIIANKVYLNQPQPQTLNMNM